MVNRFGELVREKRKALGWSLEKAATELRTFKGYICGIERGTTNPPSPKLTARMARIYGIPEAELVLLGYVEKAPKIIRPALRQRVYPQHARKEASGS